MVTTAPITPGETKSDYFEMTDEEGKTYWSFNTYGGEKLIVTFKTNSNDTEANGAFNPPGGWNPEKWTASPSGGPFTLEYPIPAGQNSVEIRVWWPTTCTVESAILKTSAVQTQPTTAATTVATTTTTTTTTTAPTQPTDPGNTIYGDADDDGDVDIMDVIALNKSILGSTSLSPQGKKNADVDRNSNIDTTDALNVLKYVVKLIQLPV